MPEEVIAKGTLELDVVVNQNAVNRAANEIARNLQDKLGGSLSALERRISSGLGTAIKGVTQTIKTFGAVGAAAVGGVLAQSILAGVSFNALQQRVRAALKALLQDGAKAEALLKDVNALVDDSPFAREIFLQATQQLVGFGVQAAKIVPILDAIQQAAAGISGGEQALSDFADIFARIQAQGRITGRELERFGARGVDAATILQRAFGKTRDELVSLGSAEVIDALVKGLQEQFGGATEALGETLDKAQDRFRAAKRFLGAELTKELIDPTAGGAAVEILNNFADILRAITKIAGPFSSLIGDIGRGFVVASQAVEDFIKNISIEQVQAFVDQMKKFAPFVIAAAGALGGFVTKFAAGIPIIGNFLPVLNPVVAAIVGFGLAIPAVRDQILAIAQALIGALKPAVDVVLATLPTLQELFSNIANAVGPALQNVIISIAPIVLAAAKAFQVLVNILNPVIKLLSFPGISIIISLIFARLVAGAIASSSAFGKMAVALSIVIQRIAALGTASIATAAKVKALDAATSKVGQQTLPGMGAAAKKTDGFMFNLGKSMAGAGKAGGVLKAGIGAIGGALTGLISPLNFVLLGLQLFATIQARIAKGNAKAKEIASAISEGIDPHDAQELNTALERRNKILGEQEAKIKAVNDRLLSFTPSSKLDIKAAEAAKDAANEEYDALIRVREIRQDILDTVSAKTGKTIDEVLTAAAEAGIDLSNVPFDKGLPTIDRLVAAIGGVKAATDLSILSIKELNNLLAVSTTALQENLETSLKDINPVLTAQKALNQAQLGATAASKAVTDARTAEAKIGEQLTQLDIDRQRVLRDTITPLREITNAERALEATRRSVKNIDDQIIETQNTLNRLRGEETAEDLASADRDILRAKIALNEARRAENELLAKANEEQAVSISLAGLSVDEIKATLANARATIAAQKARQKAVKTAKTAQEIEDEILTLRLNVLDAEQRLKDSERSRIELVTSTAAEIEENEQRLTDLALEKQIALESQGDAQTALNLLRAGETTLARALKTVDDQIKDAKLQQKAAALATTVAVTAQKTATEGVRDASIQLGIETAKITKNIEDQVKFTIDFLNEQLKIPGLSETIKTKIRETIALRQEELEKIREINREIARINALATLRFNVPGSISPEVNDAALVKIAEAITDLAQAVIDNNLAEANAINSRLQELARATGTNIAVLGDGAVVNRETLARIGESGREVVLPLTRQARLKDLLQDPRVLSPVLNALGRISLPSPRGSGSISPTATAIKLSSPSGAGGQAERAAQRQANQDLAKAIVQEMIAAGIGGGGVAEGAVQVVLSTPVQDPNLIARKLKREVMDELNKR